MSSLLTDPRANQLHLPDIVGQGYGTFWRFKGRYRVCKGSRASKKSKTTALWYIVNLMRYPQANLLVIRKVYRTLHDSCFTDLKYPELPHRRASSLREFPDRNFQLHMG